MYFSMAIFFVFQADDGIRDGHVTGVQTCALPISTQQSQSATPNNRTPNQAPQSVAPQNPQGTAESSPNDADAKIGRASCRERERNEVGAESGTPGKRAQA